MKFIDYIIVIAVTFLFASCSLDEKSYTERDQNTYINNASEANTVLLGVYRTMVSDGAYGQYLSMFFTLPSDIAKVSGNSTTNWRGVTSNAYTSTAIEVRDTWKALYNGIYNANDFIERLSVNYKNFTVSDQQLAAIYMAEARSLRALYYFELVRWFGHIVLMTDTEQSRKHPSTFEQADPVEVYKFIEKDLLYAIENLPYANQDTWRADNSFRFSKGSALGLLTKVYATWAGAPLNDESKWEAAVKTAKTLIDSGNHGLLEDFDELWKNSANSKWDNTESLIEVSFYSPTITGTNANDPSGRIGKWNGVSAAEGTLASGRCAGNWRVIPTFAQKWWNEMPSGNVDKRFDISIADHRYVLKDGKPASEQILTYSADVLDAEGKPIKDEDGNNIKVTKEGTIQDAITIAESDSKYTTFRTRFNDNIYPGKWDMGKYETTNYVVDANKSNVNWYVLRYADVLLLYAEALNEWQNGPTADAYAAVNMIRRRAYGLPLNQTSAVDLASGMSYNEFKQAVKDERAYELAFEGHRRQDLVRWGEYYDAIHDTYFGLSAWNDNAPTYYICFEYTIEGKNELLPIPQRDLDLMDKTKIKQNPGWE